MELDQFFLLALAEGIEVSSFELRKGAVISKRISVLNDLAFRAVAGAGVAGAGFAAALGAAAGD
ncbi:hypothetical protein L195_g005296 [Trifolium pratense]|uniref:Uncharacterized protein n=1 Tax=Trifolium pratense TaxID=57577 RepID=A0A2K3P0E7_TRIPR|nr:hypothetical protein L195_g005296 [Trifolium pratense]